MLDLMRLRTLREFAVRGTVAGAAAALGYTPSAVSQQLATLEREAGAPLLRRSGRRLLLTPAGRDLADRAEQILALVERAHTQVRAGVEGPAGTVRLAVFQSAALALLPSALPALRRDAPAVRVEVTQSEPASALQDTWAREYDVVVAEEYPHHSAPHYPGLVRETLITDQIRAVGDLAGARTLADLHAASWVMEPPGTASRHFAEQTCRTAGFEPDVRYETADLQAHVALAAAGVAVALLPGLMATSPSASEGGLALPGAPRRTVFAAYREAARGDRAISATLAALRDAARAIPAR